MYYLLKHDIIDEEFKSDEVYAINKIMNGQSIFIKFWILGGPFTNDIKYNITNLPGSKKGISTSIPTGFNIGIDKDIGEKRINAAVIALKYLSSKDIQKRFLKRRQLISAIKSLYYDEEVCEVADCNLFKNMQPLRSPFSILNSTRFRDYVYKFLYGDMTPKEVQKKIIDLTKIYDISLDTTYSYLGLIITILISITAALMFISLLFLNEENFLPFFSFLSIDFWIFSVIGSILILCLIFIYFGKITEFKCYLYSLIQSLGFSFTFIPILHKLITIFPEINKISRWLRKHKYIFFLFFIIIDNIINSLLLIKPFQYSVVDIMVEDGQNFQICKAINTACKLVVILKWIYVIILFLILTLLIFIEWNIKAIHYDLTFIMSAIYIDLLAFLILIIFNNIKVYNFTLSYIFHFCLNYISSITSYIFIFGYRLIIGFSTLRSQQKNKTNNNKKNIFAFFESNLPENVKTTQSSDNNTFSESNYCTTIVNEKTVAVKRSNSESFNSENARNKSDRKTSLYSKILNYHYNADTIYNTNGVI